MFKPWHSLLLTEEYCHENPWMLDNTKVQGLELQSHSKIQLNKINIWLIVYEYKLLFLAEATKGFDQRKLATKFIQQNL